MQLHTSCHMFYAFSIQCFVEHCVLRKGCGLNSSCWWGFSEQLSAGKCVRCNTYLLPKTRCLQHFFINIPVMTAVRVWVFISNQAVKDRPLSVQTLFKSKLKWMYTIVYYWVEILLLMNNEVSEIWGEKLYCFVCRNRQNADIMSNSAKIQRQCGTQHLGATQKEDGKTKTMAQRQRQNKTKQKNQHTTKWNAQRHRQNSWTQTQRTQGGININSLLDAEASWINLEWDGQTIWETARGVKQTKWKRAQLSLTFLAVITTSKTMTQSLEGRKGCMK